MSGKKKILVMGLDNSGKTSIILSLQGNRNLLSFYSLKPTPGLKVRNAVSLEEEYFLWDFGGQEQYRAEYLQEFGRYKENLDQVIFVIDVQDPARYDVALAYFSDILARLGDAAEAVKMCAFLHKYDPNLEKIGGKPAREVANALIGRVKALIPPAVEARVFKTTIYTVFQKTLAD